MNETDLRAVTVLVPERVKSVMACLHQADVKELRAHSKARRLLQKSQNLPSVLKAHCDRRLSSSELNWVIGARKRNIS